MTSRIFTPALEDHDRPLALHQLGHLLSRLVPGGLVVRADVGEGLRRRRRRVEGDDLDPGAGRLRDDRDEASVVQRGDGDAVHPLGDQLLDRLDLQRQLELLRVHLVDVDVVFLGGGLEALIARLVIRVDALGDHHEGLLRSGWGAVRHEEERREDRQCESLPVHGILPSKSFQLDWLFDGGWARIAATVSAHMREVKSVPARRA